MGDQQMDDMSVLCTVTDDPWLWLLNGFSFLYKWLTQERVVFKGVVKLASFLALA